MNCTCRNQACQIRIARNLKPFCDPTLVATPNPKPLTESEARAMARPGQAVVKIYPNMGHGPARWIIRGRAQA